MSYALFTITMLILITLRKICCTFNYTSVYSTQVIKYASLSITNEISSTGYIETRVPLEFVVTVELLRTITPLEDLIVRLPRFTRVLSQNESLSTNESLSYKNLYNNKLLAKPSYGYYYSWIDGASDYDNNIYKIPYLSSELQIKHDYDLIEGIQYSFTVFKENGIGAICGFPGSTLYNHLNVNPQARYETIQFYILTSSIQRYDYNMTELEINNITLSNTNYTLYNNNSHIFDVIPSIGKGCVEMTNCYKNGVCDYCFEKCRCFDGFGSEEDMKFIKAKNLQQDCSL
eukprot:gene16684-22819_t